jgi:hypothetical protein
MLSKSVSMILFSLAMSMASASRSLVLASASKSLALPMASSAAIDLSWRSTKLLAVASLSLCHLSSPLVVASSLFTMRTWKVSWNANEPA